MIETDMDRTWVIEDMEKRLLREDDIEKMQIDS